MSRWVHAQAEVTVGDNKQKVRGLNHKERSRFAQASKDIRDQKMQPHELPALVASMGCVGLQDGDLDDMPAQLMDACVERILELTGVGDKDEKPGEDPEKKGSSLPSS